MLFIRPKSNVPEKTTHQMHSYKLSYRKRPVEPKVFESLGMMDGNGNLNVVASIAGFFFGERPCTVIRVVNINM